MKRILCLMLMLFLVVVSFADDNSRPHSRIDITPPEAITRARIMRSPDYTNATLNIQLLVTRVQNVGNTNLDLRTTTQQALVAILQGMTNLQNMVNAQVANPSK